MVLLAIVASVGYYFFLNSKLTRINALADYTGRPAAGAGTNWLLTGSDSRGGLSRTEEDQLALGHDITGARTDTIMVLHLPANGNPPILMSIPRDSYVSIPGHGYNKINAAYSLGGPQLLAQTVQNATGLYISHYMGIGLGGLAGVVNDVGGVRTCLSGPMVDPKAGLNLQAGCQTLNGAEALGYVRTRNFAQGDLQRGAGPAAAAEGRAEQDHQHRDADQPVRDDPGGQRRGRFPGRGPGNPALPAHAGRVLAAQPARRPRYRSADSVPRAWARSCSGTPRSPRNCSATWPATARCRPAC